MNNVFFRKWIVQSLLRQVIHIPQESPKKSHLTQIYRQKLNPKIQPAIPRQQSEWKDIFCWHLKILAHLTESWSSFFTLLE